MYKKLNRSLYFLLGGILIIGITLDVGVISGFTAIVAVLALVLVSVLYFVRAVIKGKKEFDLLGDKNSGTNSNHGWHINQLKEMDRRGYEVKINPIKGHETLTENDMSLFEKEINNIQSHLKTIEQAMNTSESVGNIMNENNRWESLVIFHHSILNSPERLTDISDFAYVNLPYLSELITMHVEIENEVISDDYMLSALEKSHQSIEKLADLLKEDYLLFRRKNVDKLTSHLKLVDAVIDKSKRKEGMEDA